MATVFIPAQLRKLTAGVAHLSIEGATLGEVLRRLEELHPGVRARLCDGDEIAAGLQVAIDGAIVSRRLSVPVSATCEIHFLPAFGGG